MSGDKRSVATDALEVLGTILTDKKVGRDAVHLACFPGEADHNLMPGEHVGLLNGKISAFAPTKLGIVDPFITGRIARGDNILLIIYPRKIESLRHIWTHPQIPDEPVIQLLSAAPPPAAPAVASDPAAELRSIIQTALNNHEDGDYVSVADVMEAMEDTSSWGGYVTVTGHDAHGPLDLPLRAWDLFEQVHGRRSNYDPRDGDNEGIYFSCSC